MPSDDTSRFPKLNDTNYAQWHIQMEAHLIKKKLWSNLVEITINDPEDKMTQDEVNAAAEKVREKRDVEKIAEARAELILNVEGNQLAHMKSKDPEEIWNNLRIVHRARGFATSLALRRKFLTSKKGRNQLISNWIAEIEYMAFNMELVDIEVSDQDKILALTLGLPPSYESLIISFDGTSPDQLTLENVMVRLLNEENRQRSRPTQTQGQASTPTGGEALAVSPTLTCYFCDKPGHLKKDCLEHKAYLKSKNVAGAANVVDEDSDEEDDIFGEVL